MIDEKLEANQRWLCNKYNVKWVAAPAHLKVGIARNVRSSLVLANGLRLSPEPIATFHGEEAADLSGA